MKLNLKSHAKINLALNVTGKNKLLHRIESIISFIDLHDVISIKKIRGEKHNISFQGKFAKGIGKKNTVQKLFQILDREKLLLNQKFRVSITKNIHENKSSNQFDLFNEENEDDYQDQIIMHMIIVNNDKNENNFQLNNLNNNDDCLFLEVNFISIPNNLTFYLDKLLENHQIKIRRYMSGNYIKSYFDKDETDLSMMANKLNNGLNINEVQLVSKSIENKGFFEKFFQLFS